MTLMESVLISSNARKYIKLFRDNNIYASTLAVLSDEDLKILGVKEGEVRKKLLDKVQQLKITPEKFNTSLSAADIDTILKQINHQLERNNTLLCDIASYEDLILCDIQLGNVSKCILNCIESFEHQLNEFENKLCTRRPNRKRFIATIGVTTVLLLIFGKYCRLF
ncbi:hypothetical protein FQA39_LY12618 [Lamprigera yunnana]|nr:hypothetical protein FQA39_LY12618 [Lamprigera yunnana]